MNLEEMKVYAKELGVKSVHLYKSEEKLQAKIDEKLAEDSSTHEEFDKMEKVSNILEVLSEDELPSDLISTEPIKESVFSDARLEYSGEILDDVKDEEVVVAPAVKKIRKWKVLSGKFYMGENRYVAGDVFESEDDYSKVFPIKEV